jgi:hypothetical protein
MNQLENKYDFKEHLLTATRLGILDNKAIPLIEKFDSPSKAIQILELLDLCCSDHPVLLKIAFDVIGTEYKLALVNERTTHEEVIKLATWRNNVDTTEKSPFYNPYKGWITVTYTEPYIKQKE